MLLSADVRESAGTRESWSWGSPEHRRAAIGYRADPPNARRTGVSRRFPHQSFRDTTCHQGTPKTLSAIQKVRATVKQEASPDAIFVRGLEHIDVALNGRLGEPKITGQFGLIDERSDTERDGAQYPVEIRHVLDGRDLPPVYRVQSTHHTSQTDLATDTAGGPMAVRRKAQFFQLSRQRTRKSESVAHSCADSITLLSMNSPHYCVGIARR